MFGAIVGAVLGILFAPRAGKETREQFLGRTDGFGGQVERVKGAVEAGKEQASGQSEALKRKIAETRELLQHQMDRGDDVEDQGEASSTLAGEPPKDHDEVI